MIMPLSYVYKLTNKINGKVYIGKSNDPTERLIRHLSTAKTGKRENGKYQYIHKAIHQYGKHNFIFEIIETCGSEDEAFERESYWIKKLQSNHRDKGYNLNEGGKGGRNPSEEVRQKISKTLTGRINNLNGLLKRLYKLFSILPNYRKEIYKSLGEIEREKQRQKIIEDMDIKKIERLNNERLSSDVKKLVLHLYSMDCFRKSDIAKTLGLKESAILYIIETCKNGVPPDKPKRIKQPIIKKEKNTRKKGSMRCPRDPLPKEQKEKIFKALKGKIRSQATRERISQSKMGEDNGMHGKTHSLETRQQMSISQSARKVRRPLTEEEKQAISITMKNKPRPPRIPDEIKKEVIELFDSGNYTKKQLAEKFGIKYNSVVKIIRVNKKKIAQALNMDGK